MTVLLLIIMECTLIEKSKQWTYRTVVILVEKMLLPIFKANSSLEICGMVQALNFFLSRDMEQFVMEV